MAQDSINATGVQETLRLRTQLLDSPGGQAYIFTSVAVAEANRRNVGLEVIMSDRGYLASEAFQNAMAEERVRLITGASPQELESTLHRFLDSNASRGSLGELPPNGPNRATPTPVPGR